MMNFLDDIRVTGATLQQIMAWHSISGWASPEKMLDMYRLVRFARPSIVIEIGTYAGRSFLPQVLGLKHNDHGVAWAVDPWEPGPTQYGTPVVGQEFWVNVDFASRRAELEKNLQDSQLLPWARVLKSHSIDAAPRWGLESVDILHIDGNHTEEISSADVETYLPKLKPGGFLWLDDSHWPSLAKARRIVESRCEFVHDYGYCLLMKKPK
jgi:predicted O-methyltransferase YrrM